MTAKEGGVEQEILEVLRGSTTPLKALDIARKIGRHSSKKAVNQVIYQMKEVEIVFPGQNPPLWRICQTSPSSSGVAGGCSPPTIPLSPSPVVPSSQNPTSVQPTSSMRSSPLYTHTKHEDGTLSFTPVKSQGLHSSSASPTTPVQESLTNDNPLDDCTTVGINESGSVDTNSHLQIMDDNTAIATCVTPILRTPQQGVGGNKKRKIKLAASFASNRTPELDKVTQGKGDVTHELGHVIQKENHVPPDADHVTQEDNHVPPDADHVTQEMGCLADEMASMKVKSRK